jgi:hypothetical protein
LRAANDDNNGFDAATDIMLSTTNDGGTGKRAITRTVCKNTAASGFRGIRFPGNLFLNKFLLQEEQYEHGHGQWEGKQKGKSDKRITESKARQKETPHGTPT